ncbi:MAG: hypothetical protein CVT49_01365 [candidate division Zixibacteria bacterium HGW-Zixibacteria-1]|nr:MAG: hypothetical protein CVT49_01365 [candidate division Zixibacteria bacterium HGW-Zixibacteria-1]
MAKNFTKYLLTLLRNAQLFIFLQIIQKKYKIKTFRIFINHKFDFQSKKGMFRAVAISSCRFFD